VPNTLIPTSIQFPVLILIIVGGLIAWAAGYRLFRFVLTLFGFYIGALAATAVLGPGDRTLVVFAGLGGGIVGALIMFFGYFVGVALVGAGTAALAAQMIWSRIGGEPHAFVVILAAVAGAAVAMALQRYVIIVTTAFAGSWIIVWALMQWIDSRARAGRQPAVWMVYPFDFSHGIGVLAVWLAMALVGVFIQLRFTGRVTTVGRAKTVKRP
jgi:hypothetical protein